MARRGPKVINAVFDIDIPEPAMASSLLDKPYLDAVHGVPRDPEDGAQGEKMGWTPTYSSIGWRPRPATSESWDGASTVSSESPFFGKRNRVNQTRPDHPMDADGDYDGDE